MLFLRAPGCQCNRICLRTVLSLLRLAYNALTPQHRALTYRLRPINKVVGRTQDDVTSLYVLDLLKASKI